MDCTPVFPKQRITKEYVTYIPPPGLTANFYLIDHPMYRIPELTSAQPRLTVEGEDVNYIQSPGEPWHGLNREFINHYAGELSGFIRILKPGTYTFFLESADGSRLEVDHRQIINNDGRHDRQVLDASVELEVGTPIVMSLELLC